MATRLRRVTESASKRRRAAQARKTRLQIVNLRDQVDRWKTVKEDFECKNDAELAKLLIDSFLSSHGQLEPEHKKRRTSTPAVGGRFPAPEMASSISPVSSDRDTLTSGLEKIEGSSESETGLRPHIDKPKEKYELPSRGEQLCPTILGQISIDEISDPDAGEMHDEEDETYVPSMWEMSISIKEPMGQVIQQDDLNAIVHDIVPHVDDEDEPLPHKAGKGIKHPTKEDVADSLHLVSNSCLMQLASLIDYGKCRKCDCQLKLTKKKRGTAVVLTWSCENQHAYKTWYSQPLLRGGTLLGNVKFMAAILLSGNNYQKINLLCKFADIQIPSVSTFTQFQSHFVVPIVDEYWDTIKQTAQEELRATDVVISGDGRMDSPGHCAKYCTYTVMDQASKKILAMEIVDKRECALISNRMEAVGFQRAMNELKGSGFNVVEVVTDAHPQISSIMRKNHHDIRHSWDVWHGSKNLGKKLCAASQEKGKQSLKPWISSITNHFFYATEHCEKNDFKLATKMTSVINHCTDRHKWALGQCDHGELEEDPKKPWLDPHDPSTEALERIITDKRFQSTLKYYTTCQTTSELESFNNHLLMYAAKRQAFSYPVYKCRCQLAAIDYMEHLDRPYKRNKNGEIYYNRTYSKAANHFTVHKVKAEKEYKYIKTLLQRIVEKLCGGGTKMTQKITLSADDPKRISKTIAPFTPPSTKELAERQQPRLEKAPKPGTSSDPF